MDVVLRARHDALVAEFPCAATEFRIVKTPPGSAFSRSIDAVCTDARAGRFGNSLVSYEDFCASCLYLRVVEDSAALLEPAEVESGDG